MFNHVPVKLPQLTATNKNGVRLYETPEGKFYPSITTVLSIRKKEGYHFMNVPFYLNGFHPIVPYEKSLEDYQYYYLSNNNDKWLNNPPSPNKSKSVRKKRNTQTNLNNSNYNDNSSLDPHLTQSRYWELSRTSTTTL